MLGDQFEDEEARPLLDRMERLDADIDAFLIHDGNLADARAIRDQ